MPKKAKELGPLQVNRLRAPGLHAVGGVAGLHLQVSSPTARSWVLRVTVGTKRRDIGLGGFDKVTLAGAREKAREHHEKIALGIDPVDDARASKSALAASQAATKTFEECAEACIAAKESGWRNAKHAAQWRSTLETHAYPHLGKLQVRHIGLPQVLAVIEPIWATKTETASRVRTRIEAVLDWATTRGYREGLNPARWKGHLDTQLPKPSKVKTVVHHAALAATEMAPFMAALRAMEGTGARALEFAILTAARSGEVRGATWPEIDFATGVWTIPAARMKANREHRVPLSPDAVRLLKAQHRLAGVDLIFPAPRGGQMSDMTLLAVLRRMETPCVPHGFRSTFKDWARDLTSYPSEMSEIALAHSVGSATEQAYARSDMIEKRRRLMTDWARFCAKPQAKANVIELKKRAAR